MSDQISSEEIVAKVMPAINQLASELETENPGIDTYLDQINENLREFPELVHLLDEESIKMIFTAWRKKTQVKITVKQSRSKKGTKGLLDDGTSMADLL